MVEGGETDVAAAMEPGVVASEVARAVGINTSQVFCWHQQLCERAQISAPFKPVAVAPEPEMAPPLSPERASVIEIEFVTGEIQEKLTAPMEPDRSERQSA